jgi:hypothetical protein
MKLFVNYFKSRTVWFGLLVVVLSWFQQAVGESGLSSEQVTVVGSILGALIIALRSVTTVSLEEK